MLNKEIVITKEMEVVITHIVAQLLVWLSADELARLFTELFTELFSLFPNIDMESNGTKITLSVLVFVSMELFRRYHIKKSKLKK